MAQLDLQLFQWIAAGTNPSPLVVQLALIAATGGAWACAVVVGWALWRHPSDRAYVLAVLVGVALTTLTAHAIADALELPRPFVIGLSPEYLDHSARGSLPSAHASSMSMLALAFVRCRRLRSLGLLLLALTGVTAWARVYLGVHFPLDIVAGLLLGVVMNLALAGVWHLLRRLGWVSTSLSAPAASPGAAGQQGGPRW